MKKVFAVIVVYLILVASYYTPLLPDKHNDINPVLTRATLAIAYAVQFYNEQYHYGDYSQRYDNVPNAINYVVYGYPNPCGYSVWTCNLFWDNFGKVIQLWAYDLFGTEFKG